MNTPLSVLQDEIKRRFQPKVNLETGWPGGPVSMQGGQVQVGNADDIVRQQRQFGQNPFALPKNAVVTPVQEPQQQPTMLKSATPTPDPTLPPERSIDYGPPPKPTTAVSAMETPPPAMEWNPIRTKASGEPEISPTAQGDRVGMLEKEREALERWKPQGHRGFKQILKEGLEGATVAGQATGNPWSMLAGFGVGAGSGAVQPNVFNKEFQIRKTDTQLQNALQEQAAKAQTAALQYRPYYQQQQLNLGQERVDQTKRRNDAYLTHIDNLSKEHRAEAARKIWMNGAADGDPEFKAQLANRMGFPPGEELPDTDKGTIEVDANGKYTVVHGRTGTATPVTQTTTTPTGQTQTAPVGSFRGTQEAEKKREFEITTAQRAELAKLSRQAAKERALIMAGAAAGRLGDPDKLNGVAKTLEDMADGEPNTPSGRRSATSLREKAADIKKEAAKASGGQSYVGGQAGQPSNRQFNENAFREKFKEKNGRYPTEEETAPYRNARQ